MKRICKNCKLPIKKHHRWRIIRKRFFIFEWDKYAHNNCQHPEMGPATVKQGPLPEIVVKWPEGERENG